MRKTARIFRSEWFWGYVFAAPVVVGVLVFHVWPILYTFYMSLTDWTGLSPGVFQGIENFRELFRDEKVFRELFNTLVYAVGTVPPGMILSVIVANAIDQKRRGREIYTIMYFLPNVTMPAAVVLIWSWMFDSKYGIINYLLGKVGLPQPIWMGDAHFIMPAIIIISIWMGLGYNIVMLLAGLKGIPDTYYEAARVDGASERTQFFRITLPMLSPHIFFLLVMSVMGAFKAFDVVFMVNSSQSYGELIDASRTMVYGIFERGFNFYQMGYASAEAVLLFVIIALLTGLQFMAQKRWVYYE